MNITNHAVRALKALDQALLGVGPRMCFSEAVERLLVNRPVVLADVGAAGGLGTRWRALGHRLRLLAFEPRPGGVTQDEQCIHFPIALWDQPGTQTLHVAKDPESSSLLEAAAERMRDYANAEWLVQLSTVPVPVDTLDRCLSSGRAPMPHFLKLDVEGGELRVLQGAAESLRTSLLGIQAEVSFVERHRGGSTLADTEAFLSPRGFELFHLNRQSVIRRNMLHGGCSRPQLVWGDAVYFLSRRAFLERLQAAPRENRQLLLVHMIALLLCFGVHDYAVELVDAAAEARLVEEYFAGDLRRSVGKSAHAGLGFSLRLLAGAGLASVIYLAVWLIPDARIQARFYLKRRVGLLAEFLQRLCARGGAENATIGDD